MSSSTAQAAPAASSWRWALATSIACVIFIVGLFKYQESVFPLVGFIVVLTCWMARTTNKTGWFTGRIWLRVAQIVTIMSPFTLAFIASEDDVFVNLRTGETSLPGILIVFPFVTPIAHIPIEYSVDRERSLEVPDVGTFTCGMSLEHVSLDVQDPKAIGDLVVAHAAAGDLKTYIPSSLRTTMDDVLANILKQSSTSGDGRIVQIFEEETAQVESELARLHLSSHKFALSYSCHSEVKIP